MLLRKAPHIFPPITLCLLIHLTASEHCKASDSTIELPLSSNQEILNITNGAEKFGLELLTKVSDSVESEDFIMSPFSVWALLLLLVETATGTTLNELRTVLHINEERPKVRQAFNTVRQFLQLKTATVKMENTQAMYYDVLEQVNSDYISTLTSCYSAKIQHLKYTNSAVAVNIINNAISTETKGSINDAIAEEDITNANLLLTSTLYFEAQWQLPFNKSDTQRIPFYDMNGIPIGVVDMMFQMTPFNYSKLPELQGHVLELPYGNENRLCMLAVLPNKGISVNQVVHNLQKLGVSWIFSKLEEHAMSFAEQEVEVYLPRFDTVTSFPLRGILEELGLKRIFNAQLVEFEYMAKSLYVKDVVQTTKIIVDEDGTEAATVAAAILNNKTSTPIFYFNRPFLYLIVEKNSKTLLFAGQIANPK